MMIGSRVSVPDRPATSQEQAATKLEVSHLSLKSDQQFGIDLKDICFSVRGGEILGIGGVAGNGQSELMAALSGEMPVAAAESVRINGVAAGRLGPAQRRLLGACFVPEERNGHGAVSAFSLTDNAFLSAFRRRSLTRHGLIEGEKTRRFADDIIRLFDVRGRGVRAEARSLSGGNLQKFIVGREILQRPDLLVVAQPTWGVDAGAAAAIHKALIDLAAQGAGIVIISQDLDEILGLCQRIAVINLGRLSPPRPVNAVTIEEIGLLMGGVHGGPPEEQAKGDQPRVART
jgi:simple sugar transport system ATP-binding protein